MSDDYPQRGDLVEYEGEEWYVASGPMAGSAGSVYELTKLQPNLHGIAESKLRVIQKRPKKAG